MTSSFMLSLELGGGGGGWERLHHRSSFQDITVNPLYNADPEAGLTLHCK